MRLPKASPRTAAGMKATTRFATKRCAARSEASPASTPRNFARYSQTTASIAPVWIARLNVLAFSPLKSRRSAARIRWPVLETGRNSVRPSTTPSTRALRRSARSIGPAFYRPGLRQSGHGSVGEDRPLLRTDRPGLLGGAGERFNERGVPGCGGDRLAARRRRAAAECPRHPPARGADRADRAGKLPVPHACHGLGGLARPG